MNGKTLVLVAVLLAFAAHVAHVDAGICDSPPTTAPKGKYKNLMVFGDSYSDSGNSKDFAGWTQLPHFDGRFSNGLVWNEYLALFHGMRLINYAYGGATSDSDLSVGRTHTGRPVLGMKQQVEKYIKESLISEKDYSESCMTVWLNGNNYAYNTSNTGEEVVESMFANADMLYQRGVRCFIVGNMVDPSLLPAFKGSTKEEQAFGMKSFNEHNAAIADTVPKWTADHPGVEIFRYDINADFKVIKGPSNPLKLSNFVDACTTERTQPGIKECADPDCYAFYDPVHPSTKVHWFVAESLARILRGNTPLRRL